MPGYRSLFIILPLLLTACGDTPAGERSGDADEPVQGGTAVVSTISDFDALSEFVSTSYDANQVIREMLFMPLVKMDEEFEYQPYLAETMSLAEDGMSLTFRLRDDIRWHDGVPMTADDVVWSVETYMNPELAYANLQFFQFIDRVEKADERTVTFHFNRLHADPLANFLDWVPMPKHLLEDVPVTQMQSAAFNQNPVGNGPFRFVSWTPNQQVVFAANEDFPLGRPNLDRVVFRVIPEQSTELTELLTGRVDMVRAFPPSEAATIERSGVARIIEYPSRSYVYLAWNLRNPLFEDARVRRALSMAINRQQIVDALLYGYGEVAVTDVMPFQWQFDEDLEPLPYDPARAREILAEAGWTDSDRDGILDQDGRPFRFQLETNQGNDLREDIIVIVQENLERIGVAAQPRRAEFNTLFDRLRARDFQAVVMGWVVDFKFDPTEVFGCEGGPYNFPSFCSREADALVATALTTLDQDEARPLWERYQEIIHEQQPYTFLYYLRERLGVSNRLRGVVADARGHLVSVTDWWIAEE